MGRWWKTNACERATQWISLDLDGELSQLEQAALQRHLSGCAHCREVSTEVTAFTRMLREAPLLELEREVAYALPRRARVRAVRRAAFSLALAGLAGAAVLAGFVLPSSSVGKGSSLAFRSVQEQKRFAHFEARRLEPAVFAVTPALPVSFGALARLD
jgi:predicted anti-sigma-YlaC factor YlaD